MTQPALQVAKSKSVLTDAFIMSTFSISYLMSYFQGRHLLSRIFPIFIPVCNLIDVPCGLRL